MSLGMLLLGAALSQVAGMAASRHPRLWRAVTLAGALVTLGIAVFAWRAGPAWDWRSEFAAGGAPLHLRLDGLSAFFLALLAVVGAAGAIYAHEYWPDGA